MATIIRADDYRWSVPLRDYKTETTGFRDISRQTLIGETPDAQTSPSLTRYFEIAPGGYSSLERHAHPHSVVILRGAGHVLLDHRVEPVHLHDAIYISPWCLHQFHADMDQPLGFLCVVSRDRDRPQVPAAGEIEALRADPALRPWVRV